MKNKDKFESETKQEKMITRIWHGYTTKENAAVYEKLIQEEIFPEIRDKKIKGYKGAQLLRKDLEEETEFTTLLWFEDLESVKGFVGENYEAVFVPEKARRVLSHFDQKATHSELRHSLGVKLE